jgi:hypothetical protein
MASLGLSGAAFAEQQDGVISRMLSVRDAARGSIDDSAAGADMLLLLRAALRNELEASEIAARWVGSTPEVEVRLAFARQAGDEARHYMLIAARLRELGDPVDGWSPVAGGYSPLFDYLVSLQTTVERVAAAQFAREAIGVKANELFILLCESAGDLVTAELYRTQIQPDERHHHEWGRRLLATLAVDPGTQDAARAAVLRTLELAEELRGLAVGRLKVGTPPGC